MMKIPFNKPFIAGKELYNIAKAVLESHLSGDGPFTKKCHAWLEDTLHCQKALLTHSCTGALELAAILCDIKPGDEIIMPSFTFVSTANAFVLRGGVPVFVDIRPDTLNMDERLVAQALTAKTKAIVPVHYAGVPCAMEDILKISKECDLWVIEDAAHAFLSKYKKKYLGTMGHLGCLSFHETKNIISGEGGALLINDERLIERAEIIREKGTNRKQFFRGETDKYTWVDIGSSFLPSEIVGAFLYAQFEMADVIISARRTIFEYYHELLKPLEKDGFIRLPSIEDRSNHNGHIVCIILESFEERHQLMDFLKKRGISSVFHYIPLHTSPGGKKFGQTFGKLANTDRISRTLLRLPSFYGMTEDEVSEVVINLRSFFK